MILALNLQTLPLTYCPIEELEKLIAKLYYEGLKSQVYGCNLTKVEFNTYVDDEPTFMSFFIGTEEYNKIIYNKNKIDFVDFVQQVVEARY